MNVWISQLHNEDRLGGTLFNLSRGAAAPKIRFYDGEQPAGGGAATTLLAVVTLADPAGVVADNKLTLDDPADALVLATGTATWARFFDGDGTPSMDVGVTDAAGTGAIKLEIVNLIAGGGIRIISAEIG